MVEIDRYMFRLSPPVPEVPCMTEHIADIGIFSERPSLPSGGAVVSKPEPPNIIVLAFGGIAAHDARGHFRIITVDGSLLDGSATAVTAIEKGE